MSRTGLSCCRCLLSRRGGKGHLGHGSGSGLSERVWRKKLDPLSDTGASCQVSNSPCGPISLGLCRFCPVCLCPGPKTAVKEGQHSASGGQEGLASRLRRAALHPFFGSHLHYRCPPATCLGRVALSPKVHSHRAKHRSADAFFHHYPLSPLMDMPSTKYFWQAKKTMITGMSEQTEAAIIREYSALYWEINIRIPN